MSFLRRKQGLSSCSVVMTFSPPHKTEPVKTAKPVTEVLLLQPFSPTPQVTFENVVPGTSVTRNVEIRNTTDIGHVVTLDRVPTGKGFSADRTVFSVGAGGTQTVQFTWCPSPKIESCRCSVNVRSEEGYRGVIFLLGTVKKPPTPKAKVVKKRQPEARVLHPSQKLNVKGQAQLPPAPKTTVKKRMVTMAKDFTAARPKSAKSKAKPNTNLKTDKPPLPIVKPKMPSSSAAPKPTVTERTVTPPQSSDVRRETFTCITPKDAPVISTDVGTFESHEFEDSLEEMEQEPQIRSGTFTPPSAAKIARDLKEEANDESSDSYNELDFSARMEELYQKIIAAERGTEDSFKTAPLDHDKENSEPSGKNSFERRSNEAIRKVEETPVTSCRRLTFDTPSCDRALDPSTVRTDVQGSDSASPPLPNILDLIDKFVEGMDLSTLMQSDDDDAALMSMIDEYIPEVNIDDSCTPSALFPSDVSSIHGTPACKIPQDHPQTFK